ncbi:Abi family protein [Paractinoplanes tereljensis]|uniref:Abi family protein n=1 Tax=Paractinoplanes tereljensis TaxID=571912 RepID=UPI001EF2F1DC|nr:Abi family protein [Actinoplanes tereljensis]
MSGLPTAVLLEERLSPERFSGYRAAVGGDLAAAVELYDWNARMGATFWSTLGHVEVLVRNAMHQRLAAWSGQRYGEPRWYLDPGNVLTPKTLQAIRAARDNATRNRRPETPGRVIAELSFGFWRFLLISSYDRSLWKPCLSQIWTGQSRRQSVYDVFDRLNDLRNRIAHHEPVYNRPIAALHADALRLAEWTCPATAKWIESRCGVLGVLRTRPWTGRP